MKQMIHFMQINNSIRRVSLSAYNEVSFPSCEEVGRDILRGATPISLC